MILILADSTDPWATLVHREAQRTGGRIFWIEPLRLLDKILLNWPVVDRGIGLFQDLWTSTARRYPLDDLTGIFARLPFPLRLDLEGLSVHDAQYVTKEATAAWLAFLNAMPCAVVNRPIPGGRPTLLVGKPAAVAARQGAWISPPSVLLYVKPGRCNVAIFGLERAGLSQATGIA